MGGSSETEGPVWVDWGPGKIEAQPETESGAREQPCVHSVFDKFDAARRRSKRLLRRVALVVLGCIAINTSSAVVSDPPHPKAKPQIAIPLSKPHLILLNKAKRSPALSVGTYLGLGLLSMSGFIWAWRIVRRIGERRVAGFESGVVEADIVGVTRRLRERSEQGRHETPLHIWTFRLERHDEEGHVLTTVPVEMTGYFFRGMLKEGDRVEVRGAWKPGQILQLSRVLNLTTGTYFERI